MIAQMFDLNKIIEAKVKAERDNPSELEVCALCNELTDVRKETHVDEREHYIEGSGQLHPHCYNQVYTAENLKESEEWYAKFIKVVKGVE